MNGEDNEKLNRDILELGILCKIKKCINMSSEEIIDAILHLPEMKKRIKEEEKALNQGLRLENIKDNTITLTTKKIGIIKKILYYCIDNIENILLEEN